MTSTPDEEESVFSPPHLFFDYKNVALFILRAVLPCQPARVSLKHPFSQSRLLTPTPQPSCLCCELFLNSPPFTSCILVCSLQLVGRKGSHKHKQSSPKCRSKGDFGSPTFVQKHFPGSDAPTYPAGCIKLQKECRGR